MNKVRCPGCKQYISRQYAILVGLSWYCDDNCLFEHERRVQKAKERRAVRSPNRTNTEPSSQRKRQIRQRDGNRCRRCGVVGGGLHVHHINFRSEGGGHGEWNLITLCLPCHELVHSDKAYWKPLLLGVIWEHYVNGRAVSVMQMERWTQTPALPSATDN